MRITFAKQGALRYTGHLDLHKILERSLRRAGLPLAYSQGFHPQPRLQLAAALPLGFASRAEVMDIWLNDEVEDVVPSLQANVPPGLTVLQATPVDERAPSLQSQVVAAEYQVEITEAGYAAGLDERVAAVMAAESLPRERRGKKYDLRPLIETLTLIAFPEGRGEKICMRLAAREGATGRPEEVLDVLGIPPEASRVERTALIFAI
jgi:radical SAM-linked protein